jgi:predicted metal-dependent hydrolase
MVSPTIGRIASAEPLHDEPWRPPIRVVSTRRRRRTVSARLVAGVLEIRVPQWMPERERAEWVERMRARIERQLRRAQPTDARLEDRARRLNTRHFGGRLLWSSIAFSDRQESRWGSCSYLAGVIRVAERAGRLPDWVLDYIVVHELAHLEVAEHSPEFWELVNQYPLAERARGYLIALDHAAGRAAEAY